MKKNFKAKCFLALLSMGLLASPVTTHAATKTTVPKSANIVVGDTITLNGKLPSSANTLKVTATNKNVTVKSISKKKANFTIKVQSNKTGSSKLKVRTYRRKRLVSTKYINLKIKAATLNTKSKTLTTGKSFTLSMPGVKSKLSVVNDNKKAVKVTRKANNSFTVKALKGAKKPVNLKIKLGKKTYTCKVTTNCKTHTYSSKLTLKPTCTNRGRLTYTCKDCGKFYHKTLKALGHNYKETITKAPTCKEEGLKTYTCERCGKNYTEAMEKVDHNYKEEVTKKATCTEEGTRTYTCTYCGKSYSETIEKLEHHYTKTITTPSTCTTDGLATYTCDYCGDSYTETIKATGHVWDDGIIVVYPTCTEEGIKEVTCTVCGTCDSEHKVPPIPHSYTSTVIQEQSCTNDEITKDTCSVCGHKEERVTKKATGHTFDNGTVTKAPTCTETGILTRHCTNKNCTETKEETIAAKGHSYNEGVVTKEPTCKEEGVKTFTCKDCGATKTEKVAKVDHKWETQVRKEKTTVKSYEWYESTAFKPSQYNYTTKLRGYYNCVACQVKAKEDGKPYYKYVYYCDKCKALFYAVDDEIAYKEIQACDGHTKHQYDYEECNKNTDETGKFYNLDNSDDGDSNAANANAEHVNNCPNRIYYSEHGKNYMQDQGGDAFYKVVYHPTEWNYKDVTYRVCKTCGLEEKVK